MTEIPEMVITIGTNDGQLYMELAKESKQLARERGFDASSRVYAGDSGFANFLLIVVLTVTTQETVRYALKWAANKIKGKDAKLRINGTEMPLDNLDIERIVMTMTKKRRN